jgi:predicted metal-dependent hydrolase
MNYEPRYLAGILFFNDQEFFEAHEVWESLWMESHDDQRKFVQGLIQAAVALYHFGNGNFGGARKLFRTGKAYMDGVPSPYWGLDVADFWNQMARCFEELHASETPERSLRPDSARLPVIRIDPEPEEWPDPNDYLEEEEEDEE